LARVEKSEQLKETKESPRVEHDENSLSAHQSLTSKPLSQVVPKICVDSDCDTAPANERPTKKQKVEPTVDTRTAPDSSGALVVGSSVHKYSKPKGLPTKEDKGSDKSVSATESLTVESVLPSNTSVVSKAAYKQFRVLVIGNSKSSMLRNFCSHIKRLGCDSACTSSTAHAWFLLFSSGSFQLICVEASSTTSRTKRKRNQQQSSASDPSLSSTSKQQRRSASEAASSTSSLFISQSTTMQEPIVAVSSSSDCTASKVHEKQEESQLSHFNSFVDAVKRSEHWNVPLMLLTTKQDATTPKQLEAAGYVSSLALPCTRTDVVRALSRFTGLTLACVRNEIISKTTSI